jgi:Oxidoreductase molybdopterin binding domain/Mo-co oxidoreductase dimerisation domain
MIAYLMNGEQLSILNGFPLRLVVPGWYSTYWVKMLNSIEVLDAPDENFWMKTAYRIPDTPGASVKPGEKGFKTVPINKMVPRFFITNLSAGSTIEAGKPTEVRGLAFGGASGVASVEFSSDGGATWTPAKLGADEGQYSFRLWRTDLTLKERGQRTLMVRATNTAGVMQPATPTWNPGGYMLNVIESTPISVSERSRSNTKSLTMRRTRPIPESARS